MKITKKYLKQVIIESIHEELNEGKFTDFIKGAGQKIKGVGQKTASSIRTFAIPIATIISLFAASGLVVNETKQNIIKAQNKAEETGIVDLEEKQLINLAILCNQKKPFLTPKARKKELKGLMNIIDNNSGAELIDPLRIYLGENFIKGVINQNDINNALGINK